MTPRDRKHLLLLAIALMALYIALGGCAAIKLRSDAYQWRDTGNRMEWYRWVVVEDFYHRCGFHAFDNFQHQRGNGAGVGACAARINHAILLPGDMHMRTMAPRTTEGRGSLCIVYSNVSEDEANRINDYSGNQSVAAHEVGGHCNGFDHQKLWGER